MTQHLRHGLPFLANEAQADAGKSAGVPSRPSKDPYP